MKPRTLGIVAITFVVFVAALILVGPEVVDLIAGPPKPPPMQPIAGLRPPTPTPAPIEPPAPAPVAPPTPAPVEPPEPTPTAKPETPKPAKAEPVGYLTINTTPSGLTIVHKRVELGKTPLKRVALPVGKQALACVDAKGKQKLFAVTVRLGKEQKVNLNWAKMK